MNYFNFDHIIVTICRHLQSARVYSALHRNVMSHDTYNLLYGPLSKLPQNLEVNKHLKWEILNRYLIESPTVPVLPSPFVWIFLPRRADILTPLCWPSTSSTGHHPPSITLSTALHSRVARQLIIWRFSCRLPAPEVESIVGAVGRGWGCGKCDVWGYGVGGVGTGTLIDS